MSAFQSITSTLHHNCVGHHPFSVVRGILNIGSHDLSVVGSTPALGRLDVVTVRCFVSFFVSDVEAARGNEPVTF